MEKAVNAMRLALRCGAHARTTGKPCQAPAMKNGRCRMHGGRAGRKPTHGRYTREALRQQREVREFIRMLSELVGR